MIAIALQFPSGRFHATPWGRHVNEGAVEWPPSPWRLLRSLVATWKRKLDDELSEADVRPLLVRLALPPSFILPAATVGHTRHYMPWFKKGPDDKTLVFDTFVAVDKSADVITYWPDAILSNGERSRLARLLEQLGFFGRAESWCSARLLEDSQAEQVIENAKTGRPGIVHASVPLNGQSVMTGHEVVRVLCADPATAFRDDHVRTPEPRKSGRGKKKPAEEIYRPLYEPNWHLCAETALLHQEKWSDPPGSRWINYVRRSDCFQVRPARTARPTLSSRRQITVARYALDAPVLPLITDTLPLAEATRVALMGKFKLLWLTRHFDRPIRSNADVPSNAPRVRSRVFSGKDETGRPLDGHRHAFYLPTDEDGDGRIDHVTIIAEMGFGSDDPLELKSLDQFRRLRRGEGDPLNLLLVGLGRGEDFRSPLFGPAISWVSATPYVVTRHAKKNGRRRDDPALLGRDNQSEFVRHVLGEELDRLRERRPELPAIESIEPLLDTHAVASIRPRRWAAHGDERMIRPLQFKRFRGKRSDDGGRRPCGAFRIVFAQPATGPICLGHSSHFGLGLFLPEIA